MLGEHWSQLQSVFSDVLSCEGQDRELYLNQLRLADKNLADEVVGLLKHVSRADGIFERAIFTKAHIALKPEMMMPERIGTYILEAHLGTGGMGSVFLARESGPAKRKVALKVLRKPAISQEALSRFEREYQALARMNHPAIAQVFQAGQTEEHRPYFAMEYVTGFNIIEFCDRHQLDLSSRISLMIAVCQGVAHAHQHAIIHRDIKPSNILVAQVDGVPCPKLIDFGIAKTLDDSLTSLPLVTDEGTFLGTPIYACPEQLSFGLVDTRSDVYGLGTVLYELLCGQPCIDPNLFASLPLRERMRLISEEETPYPSSRFLSTTPNLSEAIASARVLNPERLSGALRGELDWICAKALAKRVEDRYESALELRNDLQNYLHCCPVAAAPPGKVYRLRKFLGRHRGKVLLGAGMALMLITTTIFLGRAYLITERARKEALNAGIEVKRQAEELKVVNYFLQTLVTASNPNAHGPDIRVVDVLEEIEDKLIGELAGNDSMEASLRFAVGGTWYGLGRYQDALAQYRRSGGLWERSTQPPSQRLVEVYAQQGRTLKHLDRLDEAEQAFEKAFQIQTKHPELKGHLIRQMGYVNLLRARDQLEAATLICQTILDDPLFADLSEPQQALGLVAMGNVLIARGRWAEAQTYLTHGHAIQAEHLGSQHPQFLATANNLALCAREQGAYEQALVLYQWVVDFRSCTLGGDHPHTSNSRQGLALTYFEMGRLEEAEALLNQVLRRRRLAPDHRHLLITLNNLALVNGERGNHFAAIASLQEILSIYDRTGRRLQPSALKARNNLGDYLIKVKRYQEAIEVLEETLELKGQMFRSDNASVLVTQCTLAQALQASGALTEALALFQSVSSLAKTNPHIKPSWLISFQILEIDCLAQMGHQEKALQKLAELERIATGQEKLIEACRQRIIGEINSAITVVDP